MRTSASWWSLKPGAGRDEVAEDDVLLEADEVVDLARQGGLGEHLGRLLEARGRDEAVGLHGGLGDAQELGARRGRLGADPLGLLAAGLPRRGGSPASKWSRGTMSPWRKSVSPGSLIFTQLISSMVLAAELELVDDRAGQEPGVADRLDPDLAEHLGDDDLQVLVVDLDALASGRRSGSRGAGTAGRPPRPRSGGCRAGPAALRPGRRRPDAVAAVDAEVLAVGDEVLALDAALVLDDDRPLAAALLVEQLDAAVDLGDDRRLLGPPGLEQLGDARAGRR